MLRFSRSKRKSNEPNRNDQHAAALIVNVLEQHDLIDRLAPVAMDFTIPDCCAFGPADWPCDRLRALVVDGSKVLTKPSHSINFFAACISASIRSRGASLLTK
jgi:hypothetical protein